MRVLHILNELKFSGAEIMYVDAAPIFKKLGVELYVLNTSKEIGEYAPYFEKAGYTVLHWFIKRGLCSNLFIKNDIIFFLRKNKFDVVHVHRPDLAWIFAYCCNHEKISCVFTYHSVFPSNWYSYFFHIIMRKVECLLWKQKQTSISDSVYLHELNYYKNPTFKINNWWGYNRFFPAKDNEKEIFRRQLEIPCDTLVIISVGGCNRNKRHHDIIKALSLIKKQNPNVLYLHLGSGESLQEEKDLAKLLGIYDNIRFVGNQSDVRKFLICSDIYTMTSMYEGISLTTIEAMACHIPCVLYNVPGLKDFNKIIETGILIPENFEVLAQSVIDLYNNKEKQLFLINNAHQYIHDYYWMETNVRKMYELYNV